MGCAQSTEGVVLTKGQLNERSRGPSIPPIPDWDSVAVSTMPVQVKFKMKTGWPTRSASIEPLLNTIMAQNVAGAGYNLAAVFLPILSQGDQSGQPLEIEEPKWGRTVNAGSMCIFQKDNHGPPQPQQTLFLKAPMTIKLNHWNSSAIEVKGYEGLYSQLAQAGSYKYHTVSL